MTTTTSDTEGRPTFDSPACKVNGIGFRVGLFDPFSVDAAGHRGVGVPARRSVLGRRSVAQGRMSVSVVVLVFEVADDHSGFEQTVPVVAVEAFLT